MNNLSNQISVVPFDIIYKKDKFMYLNENKFKKNLRCALLMIQKKF